MEKVDITKILRHFPQGTILYSPMCGNVVLESVWSNGVGVKMLESDEKAPLPEIAESLGFENYYYFSRLFKNHFGVSPMQYRKEK